MSRKSRNKPLSKVITIYCEGESEVAYFKMLGRKYRKLKTIHTDKVEVKSLDANGISILEEAYRQESNKGKKSEEVYVAFDRDDMRDDEVARCVNYANKRGYKILFSSISFEIWILLHFEEVGRQYTNEQLTKKLSGEKYFGTNYAKFKGNSYDKFLYDKVTDAKKNGDKLLKCNANLISDNPYTNISSEIGNIFQTEIF
ncbi:MAG: RloB family protein [Ligilactobacillus ruminis]